MNPAILFSILLFLAAAAMLRLSDTGLVRVLGVSSVLVAVPIALLSFALNWRVELTGAEPTALGYALVSVGGVGALFLAAALLSTMLRLVFPKKVHVVGARVLDIGGN
jgi:hypothetical protein